MAFLTTKRLEELILLKGPVASWGDNYTDMEPWRLKMRERGDLLLKEIGQGDKKATVFLSYSHHDKKWAHAVLLMIEMIDGALYIDLRDDSLPRDTTQGTADILRERIGQADKFLLLVTDKTKESAWVPWELGIADGLKGPENIAVLPLSTAQGFEGQEYIERYNRVENSEMDILTLYDTKKKTAQLFSHWIHDVQWSKFDSKQSCFSRKEYSKLSIPSKTGNLDYGSNRNKRSIPKPPTPNHKMVLDNIANYGWHFMHVTAEDGSLGWAYTIGLSQTFNHPEIIMFGQSRDVLYKVICDIVNNVRNGTIFQPNDEDYTSFLEDFQCRFITVNKKWYSSFIGFAVWYYQITNFSVLQFTWRKTDMDWPVTSISETDWFGIQPLLSKENSDLAGTMPWLVSMGLV